MNFGIRRTPPPPGPGEITGKEFAKALAPIFISQGIKLLILYGIGWAARRALEEQRREQENHDRAGTN